jgi:hypothetical protein
VPLGQDQRLAAERGRRTEDGANIVRIGDLIEHQDPLGIGQIGKVQFGKRVAKDGDALMYGVGSGEAIDSRGSRGSGRPRDADLGQRARAFAVARSGDLAPGLRSAATALCQP